MFMIYGVIYLLINKITGKMYVGQTVQTLAERFKQHAQADSLIGKAIRKYGKENFTIEVIEECETREQLNEREIFWIAFFNCKTPNGYNCTDGGDSGWSHTAETRARMSAAHTGTHLSEETRKKIAKAQIGNKNGLGHCPTKEARAKMAAAQTGIPKSIEQCAKASETKRKESPFKNLLKAITERKLTYRSLAKLMGLRHQSISRKIRGIRNFTETEWAKLSEIFNLPIEYLMQRDDGQPSLPKSKCGENNSFYGRHHTAENRMKFSVNQRGESPYKNLLAEMDKRQLSYAGLAQLIGISQGNFSRRISGQQNFTWKDIANLVEIFGLSAEYLLARDDGVVVTISNRGKTPYKNLFNEMQKRKMTYAVLGELLGLSYKAISKKMHGEKNFTAEEISKLVEIFGLPAEYLMKRTDD